MITMEEHTKQMCGIVRRATHNYNCVAFEDSVSAITAPPKGMGWTDEVRPSALMAFDAVKEARIILDEIDERDFNNE